MKKVLLTKTLIKPKTEPAAMLVKQEPVQYSPPATPIYTYQQRKSMKMEFSELFQALLRIPDKRVQQRVLDAINNDRSEKCELCPRCKLQSKRTMKDASTQVEVVATTVHANLKAAVRCSPSSWSPDNSASSTIDKQKSPSITEVVPKLSITSTEAPLPSVRKKRKRKICLPQVIKKSHAQQAQNHMKPKMMRVKAPEQKTIASAKKLLSPPPSTICLRLDSLDSLSILDILDETDIDEISPKSDLVSIMANECLRSEQLKDGLLPIHDAVIENEHFVLRRQIYIWKMWKKVDLNELLTDDNDDCLQLAVVNNCHAKTIEILLEAGMNPNCTDRFSNNIIHLAMINEINVESLRVLMRSIDLELLPCLNDDGYTPLHLAVRQDCYIHAEVIINVLDERLLAKNVYQTSLRSKINFLKFYEKICLEELEGKTRRFDKCNSVKKKLLEAGDLRGGNTVLLFALENQMEHFVYFLLAHQTDPRIPNHSGQNALGFYSEFGKILNLNLKIDRIMNIIIEQS